MRKLRSYVNDMHLTASEIFFFFLSNSADNKSVITCNAADAFTQQGLHRLDVVDGEAGEAEVR